MSPEKMIRLSFAAAAAKLYEAFEKLPKTPARCAGVFAYRRKRCEAFCVLNSQQSRVILRTENTFREAGI